MKTGGADMSGELDAWGWAGDAVCVVAGEVARGVCVEAAALLAGDSSELGDGTSRRSSMEALSLPTPSGGVCVQATEVTLLVGVLGVAGERGALKR
jgi:hypothetical protein